MLSLQHCAKPAFFFFPLPHFNCVAPVLKINISHGDTRVKSPSLTAMRVVRQSEQCVNDFAASRNLPKVQRKTEKKKKCSPYLIIAGAAQKANRGEICNPLKLGRVPVRRRRRPGELQVHPRRSGAPKQSAAGEAPLSPVTEPETGRRCERSRGISAAWTRERRAGIGRKGP